MVIDRYDLELESEQDTDRRDREETRQREQSATRQRQIRRKSSSVPGGIRLRRNKRWSW